MNGVYFARARQNTSCLGVKLWKRGPVGDAVLQKWFVLLGVVLEKGSGYSANCLEHILERVLLTPDGERLRDGISGIVLWSDKGPGFKSYEMLGTVAGKLVLRFCLDFAEVNYGDRMEFKNDCDAFFGKIDLSLRNWQCKQDILLPEDAVWMLAEDSGVDMYF